MRLSVVVVLKWCWNEHYLLNDDEKPVMLPWDFRELVVTRTSKRPTIG